MNFSNNLPGFQSARFQPHPMKHYKILQLTGKYLSTGIIDDSLIRFFSQDGHWVGDKIGWNYGTYVKALERMQGAFLSASRRTSRCRAGLRLLTSFQWRESAPAYVPYCEVAGSVFVPSNAAIRAPSLRSVGIHFYTRSNNIIQLPNLIRVGGSFHASKSCNLNAPRLRTVAGDCCVFGHSPPSLEEVGGKYCIRWSFSCTSAKLTSVGGTLDLHKSTHVDLPKLGSVGGHLVASDLAKRILVPALEHIGGDFYASGAEVISARKLRSVGGSIDSTSAPDFWRPNIMCGGEWYMYPDDMKRWHRREQARIALRGANVPLYL